MKKNQTTKTRKNISYWDIFSSYFPSARKQWPSLLLSNTLLLGGVYLSSILNPKIYSRIVESVSGGLGIGKDPIDFVFQLMASLLGAWILFRVSDFLVTYGQSKVLKNISDDAFAKLLLKSKGFFSGTFSGGLVSQVQRYVSAFEELCDMFSYNISPVLLKVIGISVVLFSENIILGTLITCWAIVFIAVSVSLSRWKAPFDEEHATQNSKMTARLSDVLANVLTTKMFSGYAREVSGYMDYSTLQEVKRRRAWNRANTLRLAQGFLAIVAEVGAMWLVISLWKDGVVGVRVVTLVQVYIVVLVMSLWDVGRMVSKFAEQLSSAKEMIEVLDMPIEVLDPQNPKDINSIKGGDIVFKDISFKYEKEAGYFIESLNLRIPAGQKVGLVGKSGAGKTTLVSLLARHMDPASGSVLIDGENVCAFLQEDLRSKIAFVPQDSILFHRTIRENICYGRENATEKMMVSAAKKAHAHEFIEKLSNGYDTLVGERGVKLSGGQRQRVAIARAMISSSPILVLDEATSALDSESESFIQDAFENAMVGRTTIVIAHRLSTIQSMDRIIVLDNGKVVEDGSHENLMLQKGKYANLWRHQARGRT